MNSKNGNGTLPQNINGRSSVCKVPRTCEVSKSAASLDVHTLWCGASKYIEGYFCRSLGIEESHMEVLESQ